MQTSRFLSARLTLAWLGFLGTLTVYFCRLNLSIALVSMVGHTNTTNENATNSTICPDASLSATIDKDEIKGGEFDWSLGSRGDLLASYYYGYIWTQVAGPWFATKIGYKRVWTSTMILASVLTLLTPQVAWTGGYQWLVAARILIGLWSGSATFSPCHKKCHTVGKVTTF